MGTDHVSFRHSYKHLSCINSCKPHYTALITRITTEVITTPQPSLHMKKQMTKVI